MSDFIEFRGSKLFYYRYGAGQKTILLFHGYGQDHSAFDSWIEICKNDYRVFSFDLFFHGQSIWVESQPMAKADWKSILEIFLRKENILQFEIAGFSLGGKFALATLEEFPDRISRVILIAADGVKINFWYKVATSLRLSRLLFKRLVTQPGILFHLVRFLDSLRLVNKFILRFALSQMDTEPKRKKVYLTWIIFRKLKFDMRDIAELINKKEILLLIISGKHDKVIPSQNMTRLANLVPSAEWHELPVGHNNLIEECVSFLDN